MEDNPSQVLSLGSSDASLSALTLSADTLSPVIAPETTSYTAIVPYAVNSVTVTAIPANGNATVRGAGPAALALGQNTIEVVVTAENGINQRKYTVTVTREGSPSYVVE